MKYFLDTEFIEDGNKIDFISIALVDEHGREFYAVNEDCDYSKADPWVEENVLKPLGLDKRGFYREPEWYEEEAEGHTYSDTYFYYKKSKKNIIFHLLNFLGYDSSKQGFRQGNACTHDVQKYLNREPLFEDFYPEFWADYCNYDWVVFCQLFGKMNVPSGFPMYCNDVQQYKAQIEKQTHLKINFPIDYELEEGCHTAIKGALSSKLKYDYLEGFFQSSLSLPRRV